jgi:hypothetical protein
MFVRSSRLSTRRWFVVIAILATYLGTCCWAEKWRLKWHCDQAMSRLEKTERFYDEGRITVDRVVERSKDLLQAQLARSGDRAYRIAMMQAHRDRVKRMVAVEREAQLELHASRAYLAEAELFLEEAEALLVQEFVRSQDYGSLEIPGARSNGIPSIVKSSRTELH